MVVMTRATMFRLRSVLVIGKMTQYGVPGTAFGLWCSRLPAQLLLVRAK
jgi:hypothetical protein